MTIASQHSVPILTKAVQRKLRTNDTVDVPALAQLRYSNRGIATRAALLSVQAFQNALFAKSMSARGCVVLFYCVHAYWALKLIINRLQLYCVHTRLAVRNPQKYNQQARLGQNSTSNSYSILVNPERNQSKAKDFFF
jgi:hypothetical protein